MTRQPVLAPRPERRGKSLDGQGKADRVGAERLPVLELSRVASERDDDPSVAIDRRVGHHHLGAGGIPARRVPGTSAGWLVTRARLRVAGLQVVLQLVGPVSDGRELGARVPDSAGVDIEDADERLPDLGRHPARLSRLIAHDVGGNQDEREHENDLDEQIDQGRERDVAVPGDSVPADHRRYSTLLRMKREASMRWWWIRRTASSDARRSSCNRFARSPAASLCLRSCSARGPETCAESCAWVATASFPSRTARSVISVSACRPTPAFVRPPLQLSTVCAAARVPSSSEDSAAPALSIDLLAPSVTPATSAHSRLASPRWARGL